jgi:hypothetical protein
VGLETASETADSRPQTATEEGQPFYAHLTERITGAEALAHFFDHVPREWQPGVVPSVETLFQSDLLKARIASTAEIPDIVALLSAKQLKVLEGRRKEVRRHFNERGLCYDLVDRIALLPLTLGIHYDEQFLPRLQETCERFKAEDDHRGKYYERKCFARLSVMIKGLYEKMGVFYTEYQLDTDYILDTEMKRVVGLQYEKVRRVAKPAQSDSEQPTLFDLKNF